MMFRILVNRKRCSLRLLSTHLGSTFCIYTLTFLFVLPLLCGSLPYSFYYVADRNRDLQLVNEANSKRIFEDESYLKTLDPDDTLRQYNDIRTDVNIVIGIITVSRTNDATNVNSNPKYLTQVLSRLHQNLQQQKHGHRNTIFICNVDANPTSHSEAMALSKYFPMVMNSAINVETDRRSRYLKEKDDYVFCLNNSRKYEPKYSIILQDDAIPNEGFYDKLQYILANKLEMRNKHGNYAQNDIKWAFLKLNFPAPLAGFDRHWWFIGEGVSIAMICASICALLYEHFYRQHSRNALLWTYCVFVISFVYFGLLLHFIGRQYFLHWRGVSHLGFDIRPATSCCIAAVLYPSAILPSITTYIRQKTLPIDFLLSNFVEVSGTQQYMTVPNLFTHIGLVSSLHADSLNFIEFYIS
ncbi:GPI-N-acetylgalactosamine transferase PGAP4-like [Glandiceps talaboti]